MATPTPNRPDLKGDARIVFKNPHGFGANTTGMEVAKVLKSHIKGKTILIDGVADGSLGGEAAKSIASASPRLLILCARSDDKITPVSRDIESKNPDVTVRSLAMDLGSLNQVRRAVGEIKTWNDVTIDVLINNAGVMACPYATTEDRLESQWGVGHVGHFLLTNLLVKTGKINRGGRIINISSDLHDVGDVRFDDPGFSNGKKYDAWEAYAQTKSSNILFSFGLAKRLASKNIESFSVHPGVINTSIGRHIDDAIHESLTKKKRLLNKGGAADFKQKSIHEGVATHLVAAFEPEISKYNGQYLDDCSVYLTRTAQTADSEAVDKLWQLSERAVGQSFEY